MQSVSFSVTAFSYWSIKKFFFFLLLDVQCTILQPGEDNETVSKQISINCDFSEDSRCQQTIYHMPVWISSKQFRNKRRSLSRHICPSATHNSSSNVSPFITLSYACMELFVTTSASDNHYFRTLNWLEIFFQFNCVIPLSQERRSTTKGKLCITKRKKQTPTPFKSSQRDVTIKIKCTNTWSVMPVSMLPLV